MGTSACRLQLSKRYLCKPHPNGAVDCARSAVVTSRRVRRPPGSTSDTGLHQSDDFVSTRHSFKVTTVGAGPSSDEGGATLFFSSLNASSYMAPRATAALALSLGRRRLQCLYAILRSTVYQGRRPSSRPFRAVRADGGAAEFQIRTWDVPYSTSQLRIRTFVIRNGALESPFGSRVDIRRLCGIRNSNCYECGSGCVRGRALPARPRQAKYSDPPRAPDAPAVSLLTPATVCANPDRRPSLDGCKSVALRSSDVPAVSETRSLVKALMSEIAQRRSTRLKAYGPCRVTTPPCARRGTKCVCDRDTCRIANGVTV
ncbi:hypothetical protein EVAR_45335_1 [Eumeta japonica]|uniref:Uncharacterized protein n=1 Tax=Eumeta variegata TaxID=151549 RepID=A0A4C1XPW7_EUMVA|nr:hypothetical protein EVAR_45335_1 [Eumeta japonica]